MKTLIAFAVASGLLAGFATAQVTTRNAAGYAKVSIPGERLELVQTPFDTFDGSDWIVGGAATDQGGSSILVRGAVTAGDGGVPAGTLIHRYDTAAQDYVTKRWQASFFGAPSWTGADLVVKRGEGIWIQLPAGSADYDWYAHGQVPDTSNAVTTDQALAGDGAVAGTPGLTSVGLSYPVARDITQTWLAGNATTGDLIHSWDATAGGAGEWQTIRFTGSFFGTGGTWGLVNGQPLAFIPGRAVMYETSTGKTWSETKTDYYSWP